MFSAKHFQTGGDVLAGQARLTEFTRATLRNDPLRKGLGDQVGSMCLFHTTSGPVAGMVLEVTIETLTIASMFDGVPRAFPPTAKYVTVLPVDQVLRVDVFCAHPDDWPTGWVGRDGQLGGPPAQAEPGVPSPVM